MMSSLQSKQSSQCDLELADQFLDSDCYQLEDHELISHLDNCVSCREYLDQQAAAPDIWNKVTALLKPSEFDTSVIEEFSAATMNPTSTKPTVVRDVLELLTPSDDPHRMGRLGIYEVTGVVGVGGMGVVLKAIDPPLERVVALKVMAPQLANNEKARKRFSREAKAAAAVIHPNVIPIHHVSNDEKLPYLVMAYHRGGSLQKRLDQNGALSTVEVLRIAEQIAAGLSAAHDRGLVHRDIKPENILLEDGIERVTITDFGLARAVDDNTVTQLGTIAGTPMYMSPEQARGERLDQRSDLFSLGSVLYALCSGEHPFPADSSFGSMRQIIDEEPTPIRELNSGVPEWMEGIVQKLMAKKPSERFESAGALQLVLQKCLRQLQVVENESANQHEALLGLCPAPKPVKGSVAPQSWFGRSVVGKPATRKWTTFVVAGILAIAAGLFFLMPDSDEKKSKAAYHKLKSYLQTGESVEYSGNIVRLLLNSESGRKYLNRLDREFKQISFDQGDLPHDFDCIVGLLHDDRTDEKKPELTFFTRRKGFIGEPVAGIPATIDVSSIAFDSNLNHGRITRLTYSTSEKQVANQDLKLSANSARALIYRVDVSLHALIDNRVDWNDIWANGKPISQLGQADSAGSDEGNADIESIRGTWQIVFVQKGEQFSSQKEKANSKKVSDARIEFGETTIRSFIGKRRNIAAYKLDPTTSPKSIETVEGNTTRLGIYDLDGDTLRLCFSEKQGKKPKSFDTENVDVLVLKRASRKQALDGSAESKDPMSIETNLQAKVNVANVTISTFKKVLDVYKIEVGRYPTTKEGLKILTKTEKNGQRPNINFIAGKNSYLDPWGNPYRYRAPEKQEGKPDVWSDGPDGKPNTVDDISRTAKAPKANSEINGGTDSKTQAGVDVAKVSLALFNKVLDLYKVEVGRYPTTEEGLKILTKPGKDGKGPFMKSFLERNDFLDPWGNPYRYRALEKQEGKPDVWSDGPDGKPNTEDDIGPITG